MVSKNRFIIAEAGINHGGSLKKAFKLIDQAKTAGANAIKFQTFKAKEVCNDKDQTYTYRSQGKEITESMLEMFERYELPNEAWKILKEESKRVGIQFFSTPQNISDLQILLDIGVPAIKVGSDDFTNLPLLKSYSKTNLPLILSCGMSNLGEVYEALDTVGGLDGYPVILLLCTSQYPTPPEDTNLSRIKTLRHAFPGIPIGFSDHTLGIEAAQIFIILFLYLIIGTMFSSKKYYRCVFQIPVSLFIALVGIYWFFDRIGMPIF